VEVPSLVHSAPDVKIPDEKNTLPFTAVSSERSWSGLLNFTVPALVPSLFQSSELASSSKFAVKKTVPFALVSEPGDEEADPAVMSFTSTVPASVPSLLQSSLPFTGSVAAKKSVPFTFVRFDGNDGLAPGTMSFTRTVPASVPSLLQSSTSLRPDLAAK
jgi:hypothetical protein